MVESRKNRLENTWAHHKLEVWQLAMDLEVPQAIESRVHGVFALLDGLLKRLER